MVACVELFVAFLLFFAVIIHDRKPIVGLPCFVPPHYGVQ